MDRIKCNGNSNLFPNECPDCGRYMDDCDGDPNHHMTDDDEWVECDE